MAGGQAVKSNAQTLPECSSEEGRLHYCHKIHSVILCGHWWLENLPVAERALVVWPSLLLYMDAFKRKELPNPRTASFVTIEAAQKDPLILAKLQLFMTVARTFTPFLKKYQTDEPVMPYLGKDLAELIKVMIDMGSTLHNVSRKLKIGWGCTVLDFCRYFCRY